MEQAKALKLWDERRSYPLLFTRKSVKVLGTCFSNKNADGSYDCTIVLNELLADFSDDQIRPTLVHEVAHAITPFDHHGSLWYAAANAIGAKWGYKIERLAADEEVNDAIFKRKEAKRHYKFELYCPLCGMSWKYQRECPAVKNPQKYMCPHDKTKLKVREIKY